MWHHTILLLVVFTIQCLFCISPALGTQQVQRRVLPWHIRGFQVVSGECEWVDLYNLKLAIHEAADLTQAAVNAASNFSALPFNYFFREDAETANTVLGVLRRVQKSLAGRSDLIGATCKDRQNRCEDGGNLKAAYTIQEPNRAPIIVFCPPALVVEILPKACTNPPVISQAWVTLHEMVQIYYISGSTRDIEDVSGDEGESPRDVFEALRAGIDTTWDANAYAYLAVWAWAMGMGGSPPDPKKYCWSNFYQGNFDVEGMKAVALGTTD